MGWECAVPIVSIFSCSSDKPEQVFNQTNELLNKTVLTFAQKNLKTSTSSAVVVQKLNLSDVEAYCEFGAVQTVDIKFNLVMTCTTQMASNLVTDVIASVDNAMENNSADENGFLSTSDGKDLRANITNRLEKLLEVDMVQSSIQSILNNINSLQEQNHEKIFIDPCGKSLIRDPNLSDSVKKAIIAACTPTPKCTFSQEVLIEITSQQISAMIMSMVLNDSQLIDIINKGKQQSKDKNTGPLQDFFKGLTDIFGKWTWMVIAIVALCPIILIALAYFASSPGGQKIINKGGNVASARYGGGKLK